MTQKIGAIGLKPGDLVLVKADAFQGKRKIKERWEDKPHEMVHQIATDIPSYEVMDQQGQSHASYITTVFSSLHQKLVFPYVWVSTKYRTDVPAPPQLSLLIEGVTARLCLKQMMVWQSPSYHARENSLGWINGKLWLLPWTSARSIH